jgi:hypothetical protein
LDFAVLELNEDKKNVSWNIIQNLEKRDFEGRQMKGPTRPEISGTAACTPRNAVRLSVRTYFSISFEMAKQIGLKFCGSTQEGWQSVFRKKIKKSTLKINLRIFFEF